jgi:two-component system, NarL family, nitrate/nitrite response regulator NarL
MSIGATIISASLEPDPAPTRVLIADDHPIFRAGLRRLLETQDDFDVVGEACDGNEAVALARSLGPDLLLLDLAMPRANGIDVLRSLAAERIQTRTILLAASIDAPDRTIALRLGAAGMLLKTSATELLFRCVRAVMAGEYWVERDTVESLIEAFARLEASGAEPARRPFGLTPREMEVVAQIASGASNKDIALQLGLSEETVKHHVTKIFEKTGQSSRVELALFAAHHGLTPRN